MFNDKVLIVHKGQINPAWISYLHEELYIMMYETFDTIFTVITSFKGIWFISISSKVQI